MSFVEGTGRGVTGGPRFPHVCQNTSVGLERESTTERAPVLCVSKEETALSLVPWGPPPHPLRGTSGFGGRALVQISGVWPLEVSCGAGRELCLHCEEGHAQLLSLPING